MGTNVIKQIPSKILRSKTLKLTASKKPLEFDLFVNLILLLNLSPNT